MTSCHLIFSNCCNINLNKNASTEKIFSIKYIYFNKHLVGLFSFNCQKCKINAKKI